MRKKKLNRLLAVLIAGTMIMGQPASVLASENVETATEESTMHETEENNTQEQSTEGSSTETNTKESAEVTTTQEVSSDVEAIEEGKTETIQTETTEENKTETKQTETTEESDTETTTTTEEINTETTTNTEDATNEETTEEMTTEEETSTESETEKDIMQSISSEKKKELDALGYKVMKLSQDMILEKESLSRVAASMSSMKSDEDYIENQVVYLAESEEEAQQVAECYNGTLVEYEYGVAVAEIKTSVSDAIRVAADTEIGLPAVYPNIIYKISEELESVADEDEGTLVDEADVEHIEIDAPVENLVLPADDEHLYAVAPNDTYYGKQWYHDTMNVVEAWNASKGEGVTVAVIDSGIDFEHPDLKDNIIGHVSTMDAGNGYDDNGHGTHCAGIIAAVADNGIGVSGIAPKANIYSVKVLGANGAGKTSDIIQGVKAATDQNVDIISMSLGGICWDSLYQKAVDNAVGKGIVVIAASGNERTSQKSYPAAYNNVISVAATDPDNSLTNFSNYGTWVDIAAPGWNILSTLPTDYTVPDCEYVEKGYGYMSGTSMACPAVAGTVALMLGNNGDLKGNNSKAGVTKITKTLLDSAIPKGAQSYWGDDPNRTYPLIDAEATTYAVDTNTAEMPTIEFSAGAPTGKNVVLAGEDNYLELKTNTPHSKIYYTINGKKPTAKDGHLYTGKMRMSVSGKIKIQAVTVVGSKTSKVFSKTYTFDAKATELYSNCDKEMTVAIGKSIQLSVDTVPSYASNKKFEWTSSDTTGMIKVNKKNGKVTCNKKAAEGLTATITAATTDGSNLSYVFTVKAVGKAVDALTLNYTSKKMSYWAEGDMYEVSMPDYVSTFKLEPANSGDTKTTQYLYKSSNTKVARVDSDGYVTALAKGTAKITVTANDGSNKKAVCKVTVVNPVLDIYTYSSTGFSEESDYIPIAVGCSITMKTIINYGSTSTLYQPSNKKLDWSSDNSSITVSNGKVKCAANAPVGTNVKVTAKANDGFGTAKTVTFRIVDKIEKLYIKKGNTEYTAGLLELELGEWYPDLIGSSGLLKVKTKNDTDKFYGGLLVNTTKRDVVYRYYDYEFEQVIIVGTKPGTSKITYTARDGSNKKFTLTVKVKAPSSK